jgi:uncharacterized membrane protein YheB (UPF0754 family)
VGSSPIGHPKNPGETHRVFILITNSMMTWWLLLVPISSAFSGWLVVWLYLKLVFHPAKPLNFAGIHIQGLLPANQNQIASQLGKLVATSFFSMKEIQDKISKPENFQKIMPLVEEHIDDFLRNKLKKEMPIVSMFIGDKTISSLKAVFLKELEELFPQVMLKYSTGLSSEFNIEKIVTDRINSLSLVTVEHSIRSKFHKELGLAQLMAALLGLIVGTFTSVIILFIK